MRPQSHRQKEAEPRRDAPRRRSAAGSAAQRARRGEGRAGPPPTLVMPFPMIPAAGARAHPQPAAPKALGSQLSCGPRPGAGSQAGSRGPDVPGPAEPGPAAAVTARGPPAREGHDGGAAAAAAAGSSYPLGHVGAPPLGRSGGLDKAPVCRAQGPRDNGSLLGPRGAGTSGGGGEGAPPARSGSGGGAGGGRNPEPRRRAPSPGSGSAPTSLRPWAKPLASLASVF